MKKLIFTMLIALFSILSFNEANSCPTGYTFMTYQVQIGTCTFNVDVCVDCNVAYPSDVTLVGYYPVETCNQVLTPWEVRSKIINDLKSAIRLNSLCGLPGPCNGGEMTWDVYVPLCYQKVWVNGNILYFACTETCYCKQTKTLCWDTGNNKFVKTTSTPIIVNGTINDLCPNPEPQDPDENNPITGCFNSATLCQ
jgi:hypothetical protein